MFKYGKLRMKIRERLNVRFRVIIGRIIPRLGVRVRIIWVRVRISF